MNIGDKAICEECGTEYEIKKVHQKYCRRSCFRAAYYKDKIKKKFPSFKCSVCGKTTKLTFHIDKDPDKWETLQCSFCGVYNQDTIDPFELYGSEFEEEETEL